MKADSRSGRLVRGVVAAPSQALIEPAKQPSETAETPASGSLAGMIDAIAEEHNVEAPLVHSVIKAESNYNPVAISSKGAEGIMQLIPATARRFGVANTFNAQQNIEGGVKYLKYLMDLYHDDYVKVIAAYNAGERAVDKYGGVPPYNETLNYVSRVGKNLKTARQAAARKGVRLAMVHEPDPGASATYQPIQQLVSNDGKVYYKTQ